MAKAHAAEYGRTRADEYRGKAENCRVQAERASGDRKARRLDLAERWDEAADQAEAGQALQSEVASPTQLGRSPCCHRTQHVDTPA